MEKYALPLVSEYNFLRLHIGSIPLCLFADKMVEIVKDHVHLFNLGPWFKSSKAIMHMRKVQIPVGLFTAILLIIILECFAGLWPGCSFFSHLHSCI